MPKCSAIALAALLSCVVILTAPHTSANAEDSYPAKPVRILVGFAPGGSVDLMARFYGKKFADKWGQSFVVENRPGAAGNIAAQLVAQAKPDGHTLLLTSIVHSINASLYPTLPYDPAKNFAAIGPVALAPNGIAVASSVNITSLDELVRYAKAHPDKLTYASSGAGTLMHMGMELFKEAAGIKLLHVPFAGTGPAVNAVIGAHVPVLSSGYGSAQPFAEAGKLPDVGHFDRATEPVGAGVADRCRGCRPAGLRGRGLDGIARAGGDAAEHNRQTQ